jgi:hypothetical protein
LVLEAPATAPILSPSSAWQLNQVINDPKDDDCPKVREWIVYRGTEQAADSNEKCDKKEYESHVFAFLLRQT